MIMEQRSGTGPYTAPVVYGTPAAAPSTFLQQQQHQQQQGVPAVVQHHTHVYEGPLIQRVSLAPVLQVCPSCGHTGPTRVKRERGCCTWLQCFTLCWLFCPAFWVPCCLDCSKDLVHRCGQCNTEVARITPC